MVKLGRTVEDALQSARGRTALRFSIEVAPQSVAGLPSSVTSVSVVWEKGNKVSYTASVPVDPSDGSAEFAEVMTQTTTCYKQGNTFLPKEFTFKVQSVQPSSQSTNSSTASVLSQLVGTATKPRKTVARARVDLAQFCSAGPAPSPASEVQVPLHPQGVLCLSIRTVWLQHYDKAKANAQLQHGLQRSYAQLWGSVSDVDTYTDAGSTVSSFQGSSWSEADRDEVASGSGELDRLIQEAEAAIAAKAAVSSPSRSAAAAGLQAIPRPQVLQLSAISASGLLPRGPSKQGLPRPRSSGALPALQLQQSAWATFSSSTLCSKQTTALAFSASTSRSSSRSSAAEDSWGFVCSRRRHRRASSVPDTPTILEADLEGLDAGSCPEALQVNPAGVINTSQDTLQQPQQQQVSQDVGPALDQQQERQAEPLPFGLKACADSTYDDGDDDRDADIDWLVTAAPAAGEGQCRKGLECMRSLSGHMPAWLWPSSRLAVRGLTTDELMRRISSSRDPAALQHMCRGLLCERNDWRFRATQAERSDNTLQQELQQLRESEAAAKQQLQQQDSEGQLLHKLVDAKLQLAQSDLVMQDLKGQLEKERKRHMEALAKLTSLQSKFDAYINEQHAVAAAVAAVLAR